MNRRPASDSSSARSLPGRRTENRGRHVVGPVAHEVVARGGEDGQVHRRQARHRAAAMSPRGPRSARAPRRRTIAGRYSNIASTQAARACGRVAGTSRPAGVSTTVARAAVSWSASHVAGSKRGPLGEIGRHRPKDLRRLVEAAQELVGLHPGRGRDVLPAAVDEDEPRGTARRARPRPRPRRSRRTRDPRGRRPLRRARRTPPRPRSTSAARSSGS